MGEWYERKTKDAVGPALPVPAVYGANVPKTNNAELRTRGWELEASWTDRIGKDWSYELYVTLSDFKSIITKYDSPNKELSKYYKGKDLGDIWGLRVIGIAKNDQEMADHIAQHDQTAIGNSLWGGGDFMYANLDDNPAITKGSETVDSHGDLTVIGNSTPRYSYGIRGTLRWKYWTSVASSGCGQERRFSRFTEFLWCVRRLAAFHLQGAHGLFPLCESSAGSQYRCLLCTYPYRQE